MNNTKNRKNVRNAGNANSTRTFVISDPDAKATDNQRRAIAHAVKNGSLPRFAEEEWKNLTKGRASEIIDELRTREGDPLATWGQKKRFLELVREGFLRGVKRETLRNLRNAQIKRMIYKGMKNKEAGIPAARISAPTIRLRQRPSIGLKIPLSCKNNLQFRGISSHSKLKKLWAEVY